MRLTVHTVLRVERARPKAGTACDHCNQGFEARHHVSVIVFVANGDEKTATTHHRCRRRLVDAWAAKGITVAARDGVAL